MLIWILVFSLALVGSHADRKDGTKIVYDLQFTGKMVDCDGFKNKVMDLTQLQMSDDSESTWLSGELPVYEDIEEGTVAKVTVYKKDDITGNHNFLYTVEGDFCEHLGDKDMPWTALSEAMKVDSCPIKAKTYTIERLELDLNYAKDVLDNTFVGFYFTEFNLDKPGEGLDLTPKQISCHGMPTSVIETKEKAD